MSREALKGRIFVAHLLRGMSPDERVRNDEIGQHAFSFTMRISTCTDEPHRIAATADEFGDMLVGMGSTHKRAAADLIDAVQSVVDHHIAHGTYEAFMKEHFESSTYEMVAESANPVALSLPWLDRFDEADVRLDPVDALSA